MAPALFDATHKLRNLAVSITSRRTKISFTELSRPESGILRRPGADSYDTEIVSRLLRVVCVDLRHCRARRYEFRMRLELRCAGVQLTPFPRVPRRQHVQIRVGDRIIGPQ